MPNTNMPTIKLFNTWTRKAEAFKPITEGEVGIYTCGPTVYHNAHIGNMRAFIFADVLRRTFDYAGYKVNHVMNITDVGHLTDDGDLGEDKMLVAMRREGLNAWDIAKKYTEVFFEHAAKLNIRKPDHVPCATDHIKEQIDMVQKLEEKGFTYKTSDGVYFDTSKLDDYGYLARLDIDGLQAGERVDMGEKKNLTDFALWKFSPKDAQRDMEWDSPWGVGFPGWHIECSAMSARYLGEHFDIHTGGIDHIPVHHTNEIAQSECAHGKKFVNYWMHVAFLNLKDGAKMSKSSGKFLTVDAFEDEGISPLAYRYLCLTTHYRMGMDFDWDSLKAAATGHRRLCERVQKLADGQSLDSVELSEAALAHKAKIDEALFDDLNTAKALGHLFTMLDADDVSDLEKAKLASLVDSIFRIDILSYAPPKADVPAEVQAMLEARNAARKDRDFAKADQLRDEITALGFVIEDTAQGSVVKRG